MNEYALSLKENCIQTRIKDRIRNKQGSKWELTINPISKLMKLKRIRQRKGNNSKLKKNLNMLLKQEQSSMQRGNRNQNLTSKRRGKETNRYKPKTSLNF